jgi:hypothetical protein
MSDKSCIFNTQLTSSKYMANKTSTFKVISKNFFIYIFRNNFVDANDIFQLLGLPDKYLIKIYTTLSFRLRSLEWDITS